MLPSIIADAGGARKKNLVPLGEMCENNKVFLPFLAGVAEWQTQRT